MRTEVGVPGVASGAGSDSAVGVRPANAVALLAAAGHRRPAFQLRKWMRRPARTSGLIGFREIYLFGR